MGKDTHIRSIVKSLLYRVFGTIVTTVIALVFTGSFNISVSIGIMELISKVVLYYAYDRIWNCIKWGKS